MSKYPKQQKRAGIGTRLKKKTSICQVLNAIEEKLIEWENDTI